MLSIGRVASGQAAVAYFTGGQDARPAAGCGVGYYTRDEATAGRWVGSGAAALGLSGKLDPAGVRVLAGLLDGVGPDGARLVEPVLRADPAGRVPALPIVTAARAAAAEAGTDLPVLLGSELYRHWHAAAKTLGGGSKGRGIRADVAAAIARRCGLEAAAVYEANTAGGADAFRAALARAGGRVDGRRAGLDLTFSAPKSVSLLAAFATGAVAEQVLAAHDAAVTEAVGWLEPRVARAARGHHGDGQTVARVRTDGLVGVAFAHEVSRALDPQLHTHVVLANLARAGDGRWSALDTKAAYRHSRTAGHLYQAVLRAELTARLGVAWGPVTLAGMARASPPLTSWRSIPRVRQRSCCRRRADGRLQRSPRRRRPPDCSTSLALPNGSGHRSDSSVASSINGVSRSTRSASTSGSTRPTSTAGSPPSVSKPATLQACSDGAAPARGGAEPAAQWTGPLPATVLCRSARQRTASLFSRTP